MGAGNAYSVLLLAGGGMPADLKAATGAPKRCLIQLGGSTILERILNSLHEAIGAPRIVVNLGAGDEGADLLRQYGEGISHYCCGTGLLEAIAEGLGLLKKDGNATDDSCVLLVNADLPLLSGTQVADFIAEAEQLDADGVWPIVEKATVIAKFPETKRTWVRTKQGIFTGGNMFGVKPRLIWENYDLLDRAYQNRKNPMAMASLFSTSLLVKVMSGTASIPNLEASFSQRFNAKLRLLQFRHPEVAIDLDKLEDYEMMKRILEA